jgi:hypothetical protein
MKLFKIKFLSLCIVISLAGGILSYGQPASPVKLTAFAPDEYSLRNFGLEDYPYKKMVTDLLQAPVPAQWKTSRLDKRVYLDMMEKIVRMAATWINAEGAVIDPYFKAEWGQTTARFVSSASILLHFGRIEDLKPLVIRSMSYSCAKLANRTAESPDFWMRELSTAFICLKPIVSKKLVLSWEDLLKKVDPEKTYKVVDPSGVKLAQLNNWAVYSSGGEYTREAFGLTSSSNEFLQGKRFFETYMQPQMVHFTNEGMYRDPNDPITYDITTRLQIAHALAYGYNGELKHPYSELLRRGGLTMLLFTSPNGMAPYGGRSSQFQFQEAIIAALSELEANRYKKTNNRLAGAFKRQAHLSAHSMRRWIMDMEPLRHIKNGFIPEAQHGIEGYGKYSVYALYCSSVLGLAALYADDDIREYPSLSETGGYLIEIFPAFHKVFATVQGSHIEIDTKADLYYESTGLGRFHVSDVPAELGLSMSFTATPNYYMADSLKAHEGYAIGPAWKSHDSIYSLANLSEDLTHEITSTQVSRDTIEFDIRYQSKSANGATVLQGYKLFKHNVSITSRIEDPKSNIDSIYFTVPILVSSGLSASNVEENPGKLVVNYQGHSYTIEFDKNGTVVMGRDLFANRNGIYRNLIIRMPGNRMQVNLRLE